MRDPARIHEVCEALEKAWQQHPDMRLGQFLEMVFPHSEYGITMIFGQEDDATLSKLRELMIRMNLKKFCTNYRKAESMRRLQAAAKLAEDSCK